MSRMRFPSRRRGSGAQLVDKCGQQPEMAFPHPSRDRERPEIVVVAPVKLNGQIALTVRFRISLHGVVSQQMKSFDPLSKLSFRSVDQAISPVSAQEFEEIFFRRWRDRQFAPIIDRGSEGRSA